MSSTITAAWLVWFSVTCGFLGYDLLRNESRIMEMAQAGKGRGVINDLAAGVGPALAIWFPPANIDNLQKRLVWAGMGSMAPETFIGIKALSAGIGFALASLLASIGFPVVFVPIVAAIAWVFPDGQLSGKVEKRQKAIAREVPPLVALLVTALRAGIELGPALEEVGSEISGPLGEELRLAWRQIATGQPRSTALRHAASRCGVSTFTRFVETIVTAEERGTPDLAAVLANYMTDLRGTQRRHAEEEARKIPTKMNLPLIGCIFLPMIVLLLTPVLLTISKSGL